MKERRQRQNILKSIFQMKIMLSHLNKYMLTDDFKVHTCGVVIKEQHQIVPNPKKNIVEPLWTVPRFRDTLFWCFYIMHHSLSDYEIVSKSGFKEEHTFKISFIEALRKTPGFIKQYKIPKTTVEAEMVADKNITLIGFTALCLFYNIRAVIIKGNMFIEIASETDEVFVVRFCKGKYEILVKESPNLSEYTNNLIKVKTFEKPLNAISFYKLADLEKIAKTINIEFQGKASKRMLYDKILDKLTKE